MSGSEFVRKFYEQYFERELGGGTEPKDVDDIDDELLRITPPLHHQPSQLISEVDRERAKRVVEKFERSIALLDEQDQRILKMRLFEQLTNQEVAEALGLGVPQASMRFLRAMRKLKESISRGEEQ